MKLIADSGSTKTDWICSKDGKRVHKIQSIGINPFYQKEQEIAKSLQTELSPQLEEMPTEIYFYGAGCSFPEKQEIVKNAFLSVFGSTVKVALHSDLVAAARATCGDKEGIACIIGTGSNSCHWDGEKIVKNVPPLGYILGDEGSGAVLGKLLIADLLKNQLSTELTKKFYDKYEISYEQLMAQVYKQEFPNRNLAKYTYFLHENLQDKAIYDLITNTFTAFVNRNLAQYPKGLSVHFVGSVANAFSSILQEVLEENGYILGKIVKAPAEALAAYHSA